MYEKLLELYVHCGQAKIGSEVVGREAVKEIIRALYEALHALDITSSALLIFNGVVITAAAFAAEKEKIPPLLRCWAIVVIVLGLVASGLCLRVTHISYPFYGKVQIEQPATVLPPNAATAAECHAGIKPRSDVNFKEEFAKLDREIALRTCIFQVAWWLSMFIVVASILVIAWEVRLRSAAKWFCSLINKT